MMQDLKDIYPSTNRCLRPADDAGSQRHLLVNRCQRPADDAEATLPSKSRSKTSTHQQRDFNDQPVMKELHSPAKENVLHLRRHQQVDVQDQPTLKERHSPAEETEIKGIVS
ncbi:uncharacterized protein [Asterias amurensis]|uniref:uncharacterized protein n=1 Tax=Asterias amurensis TaxID=7602 RepID=UPI003AB37C74